MAGEHTHAEKRHQPDGPSFIMRWLINAVAIWAAFQIVPGIMILEDGAGPIILIALIFGLINAIIRPIVMILSCPLIILTLGLGTLVINAALLGLTAWIANAVGIGVVIDGFWPAFFGALVISIISGLLSVFLRRE
ncbi:MAG: phage holin family protein [Chloroflexi bacterium]|nr:phage holin family protein [Chloroflexota bacterium]